LPEQERIVKLLDEADALQKLRAQSDRRASDLIPALFHEMFGDPESNPFGWPTLKIESIVNRCGTFDPRTKANAVFKYLDIGSVDGASGSIGGTKTLLGADAPSRARQVIFEGDVVVSTVRPNLRATALIPNELQGQICSTGFCVLRPQDHNSSEFLYALTRIHWFTNQLRTRAKITSHFQFGQMV
jgi:type I restriction enzyme S subunit